MKLDGIHHITAITASAPGNVDFYARLLGMRFVKKTVNFDMPEAYHLYYADEEGTPGSVLTFFEFPDAGPGRHGAGMIHRIAWRVFSQASLDFWADRLENAGIKTEREGDRLIFEDPEGLELEFRVDGSSDEALLAHADGVPDEHALIGFSGVYAYAASLDHSVALLGDVLGFEQEGDGLHVSRGASRSSFYQLERATEPGIQGAGTVHHIAWASEIGDHEAWHERVGGSVMYVTPRIDRTYFWSIYFREPSGVLFEIATKGPGFTVDEPLDRLGSGLRLPPQHEHLREQLERVLTPVPNPRYLDESS